MQAHLDKATTRRLLLELIANGFVAQDKVTRKYGLGIDLFSIAAIAADRFDIGAERRRTLVDLSHATHCTAAYFILDDSDVVCVDCVEGGAVKSGTEIGARRPIGVDAFGIAILAMRPEAEAEDLLFRQGRIIGSEQMLRDIGDRLRQARSTGFCINLDPALGSFTIASALTNRAGDAEGALGVVMDIDDMPTSSTDISRLVVHHARSLQHQLWRLPSRRQKPWVAENTTDFA